MIKLNITLAELFVRNNVGMNGARSPYLVLLKHTLSRVRPRITKFALMVTLEIFSQVHHQPHHISLFGHPSQGFRDMRDDYSIRAVCRNLYLMYVDPV